MKLRAFSLVEAIVVMLLSAVLMLTAWKVMQYIQYQVQIEGNLLDKVERETLFSYQLQKDFSSGKQLLYQKTNAFTLHHPLLKDSVSYLFYPNFVIRKEKKYADSFFIKAKFLHLNTHSCLMQIGSQKLSIKPQPYSSCE